MLMGAVGCGGPSTAVQVVQTIELWDGEGGSGYCSEIAQRWSTSSFADVSDTRTPQSEGYQGVCVVPVSREHEVFVLESASCTRRRGDDNPLEARLELGTHGDVEIRLTEESPMATFAFGRGVVLRHPLRLATIGTNHYLACTVHGYFVYAAEPASEGGIAEVPRPFGPGLVLLDERPGAPK